MNRIKQLREDRGWNQDYLGSLLNVKRAAVSKYETEKIPLTKDTIVQLAKIFDVSIDYLLGNSENTATQKKSTPDSEELEILKRKFVKYGIIKEGEDLTDEQLDDYMKKLSTILSAFKD